MPTKNKDGSTRKKGSGRTKGSVSFVEVSLGQLKQSLEPLGDNATILVGRKWVEGLEMVGIRLAAKQLESYQATSKSNIEAATNSVDMKVEDFDDDYPDGPITNGDKKLKEMLDDSDEQVGIEEVEF